jgi:menaquinone-dependent protoporphyrinogen oxidase
MAARGDRRKVGYMTEPGTDVHPSVLVAYASEHGSTQEIAEHIAQTLSAAGLHVDLREAGNVHSLDAYEGVVIGSAVYMGRWRGSAKRLVKRNERRLAERSVWLFSSGPVGETPDEDDARAYKYTHPGFALGEAERIGAHDHTVFGGRVPDSGFITRSMRQNTPPELRDLRDWDAIARWAEGIAATLAGRPAVHH